MYYNNAAPDRKDNITLSRKNLPMASENLRVPDPELFDLPEKVLQFGTGVLLRGLPDYYIHEANSRGIFKGRIALVKFTLAGKIDDFRDQDGLYTLNIRGISEGKVIDKQVICSAISRVLHADTQWREILEIAKSKDLKLIISNTTEAGIEFVEESIHNTPPKSYPAKLLAVLYERYKAFEGDNNAGLIIIPTELIVDNGKMLEQIVRQLAAFNHLEVSFIQWLGVANRFCNSLVDRIVPGKPEENRDEGAVSKYGYSDNLRIVAEPYNLWAIEGDEELAADLPFAELGEGVVVTPDIKQHRELKLRLLNGTHTLCCGLAYLCGFTVVSDAMENRFFFGFTNCLMSDEIAPVMPGRIAEDVKRHYISQVLDRFRNPFIKHLWLNIAIEYSSKMKFRVLPLLLDEKRIDSPAIAMGFAGFLRFMKVEKNNDGYVGNYNGLLYRVIDRNADLFMEAWQSSTTNAVVDAVLKNKKLWGMDLRRSKTFSDRVVYFLDEFENLGVLGQLVKHFPLH